MDCFYANFTRSFEESAMVVGNQGIGFGFPLARLIACDWQAGNPLYGWVGQRITLKLITITYVTIHLPHFP